MSAISRNFPGARAGVELNDVHSQLNATTVASVTRPRSLEELTAIVFRARNEGTHISVAGGRHAMGGQQFAAHVPHIDMTALSRVLKADAECGLIPQHPEARGVNGEIAARSEAGEP